MKYSTSIKGLFSLALKTEMKLEEIYSFFSDKFSFNLEISNFWKSMANDEKVHISKLESLYETLNREQIELAADDIIVLKAKNNIGNILAVNLNIPLTLNDAFMLTHELEHSEINTVFTYLLKEFEPSQKQLELNMKQLEMHLNGLKNWFHKFTFDELYNI